MDNFVDVEFYAQEKDKFLRPFLDLPNGIPSHDTFNRVWSLIDWLIERHPQWPSLTSIVAVERECHIDDKVSVQRRYFISSRTADAPKFLQ